MTWGGQGGHDFLEVRHLALWSARKYREGDQDASHLCGNPSCFNVERLLWESHQLNMDRRSCMLRGSLVKDGRYHQDTIKQRGYAGDLDPAKEFKDFVKDYGVTLEAPPPIMNLAPAQRFFQSRYDASRTEWRGLDRAYRVGGTVEQINEVQTHKCIQEESWNRIK